MSHMGSSSERTHPSSFSTAFEGSAFGSGSSVLSSFEPPSDSELFEKTTLAQLLDDTYNFPGTLEELKAVISKLQSIYFYRQASYKGLKALTDERMATANTERSSFVPSNVFGTPPVSIPGTDAIWRIDDNQWRRPTRRIDQIGLEREFLLRNEVHNYLQDYGNRRRNRRPGSCPLALAPQWGNPSWNPLNPGIKHTRSTSQGTGVFLPLHLSHSNNITNQDDARLSLPDDLNS